MLTSIFIESDSQILVEYQCHSDVELVSHDLALAVGRKWRASPLDPAHWVVVERSDDEEPIFFVVQSENDLLIMASVADDHFPLMANEILNRVIAILKTCCGSLTAQVVRDEFPTIVMGLDLVVSTGILAVEDAATALAVLGRSGKLVKGQRLEIDWTYPWRRTGIKTGRSEVLLDVYEVLDAVIDSRRVRFMQVRGVVNCECSLSGMPRCSIAFSEPLHFDSISYHRSVMRPTVADHVEFVPPEGNFELLSYFSSCPTQPRMPLFVKVNFEWSGLGVTFDISLRPEDWLPKGVMELEARLRLPLGLLSPAMSVTDGSVEYDLLTRDVLWVVPSLTRRAVLTGSATVDPQFTFLEGRTPALRVKFLTPLSGSTLLGVKVASVDVPDVPSVAKGVRYSARAGVVEFRGGPK